MKKRIIILLTLLILFPINVYALNGTVTVDCEKKQLILEETTTCQITGNINEAVSSIHSVIKVGEGLELVSVTRSSIWEGDHSKVLDLYTDENKKGNFDIASFVVKAIKTGTTEITITDTVLSDASFKEHNFTVSPYNITVSTKTTGENSSSPQSSSNSSSSSSTSPIIPNYTINLKNDVVYINETTKLSFLANTSGTIKIYIVNSQILTVSSSTYNLNANETKEFTLTGIGQGATNVTIEFIPSDTTKYESIKKSYKVTVNKISNPNENVIVNPSTGNIVIIVIVTLGTILIGYSYWYFRKTQKNN